MMDDAGHNPLSEVGCLGLTIDLGELERLHLRNVGHSNGKFALQDPPESFADDVAPPTSQQRRSRITAAALQFVAEEFFDVVGIADDRRRQGFAAGQACHRRR